MKPIKKPKIWYTREIYKDYAKQLLEKNPEWWGKYDKKLKMHNCYLYAKERNKVVLKLSYPLWKEMIERYYHKAKTAIIQGDVLTIGAGVGNIRAIRVERNFKNPSINWAQTFKQKIPGENGKFKYIYHTEQDWCRIKWTKFELLANESCYKFNPAEENMATGKGFKAEFSRALNADPLLKFKYKFYPIKSTEDDLP